MKILSGRLAVIALVSSLASAAAMPLEAQAQDGFDEFSAGEWLANARAGGSTVARGEGGQITGDGDFNVTLEFLVPLSGPTTGSWTLSGSSVFVVEAEGTTAKINWTDHRAEGSVTGDRQRLSMGTTSIRSAGHYDFPGLGSYPISASDPLGPIELQVERRLCDDAYGVWIMSWNSILEGEGYTPTFDGNWYAFRQSEDFSSGRFKEIASEVFEVVNLINELLSQAPVVNNVSIIPWDIAWDLIYRAFELINELNNLSLCDQALLGDQLQRYLNALTYNLGALMATLIYNLELAGRRMNGENLLEAATMAASVGAVGPGSTYPDAGHLEEALEGQVEKIMAASNASADDLTAATAAAEQMGWDFPSDGGDE
jgi:hypothetical protein